MAKTDERGRDQERIEREAAPLDDRPAHPDTKRIERAFGPTPPAQTSILGGVAQLVEQRTFNPLVLGSSPSAFIEKKLGLLRFSHALPIVWQS